MEEIELKFIVPEPRRAAVLAALERGQASRQRLRAFYFDTLDERLAAHRAALRVRRGARGWVQTFKGATEDALKRIEHNVPVGAPPRGAAPQADLARHEGTPAGEALQAALGDAASLQCRYGTDIQRTSRVVRHGHSHIELAFDEGWITAGPERLRVCELELELVSGTIDDLLSLASTWMMRHELWLSTVSKAERGARLARGEHFASASTAGRMRLERRGSAASSAQRIVRHALAQVLANASEIGAGCEGHEHVHQLRIGIRRLRTALRELAPALPPVDPAWEDELAALFRQLGDVRDRTVVRPHWEQELEAAGAPPAPLGPAAAGESPVPGGLVRSVPFQQTLLNLMRHVAWKTDSPPASATATHPAQPPDLRGDAASPAHESVQAKSGDEAPTARALFSQRLEKLHHRIADAGRQFETLSEDERHRVRRQLKRLRYLAEFSEGLFGRRRTKRYLEHLRHAQDLLGLHVDQIVALNVYRPLMDTSPHAAFACGWLTMATRASAADCAKALRKAARAQRFWKPPGD